MRADSTMTRRVTAILPEMSLRSAWQIMQDRHIRHLPVVSAGKLLGILSDRDVMLRATFEHGRVTVPLDPAGGAMTPSPYVSRRSSSIADVARIMTQHKIDALPVLGADDELVGLVTSSDLLMLLIERGEAKLPFAFELDVHPASPPS
jgi:CBS domain-containing protein